MKKMASVRNSDGGRETRIHVSSPAICMVYTRKTVSVRNSDGGRGTWSEEQDEEDRTWMAEEDGKCAHTEEKDDVGPTANQIQS